MNKTEQLIQDRIKYLRENTDFVEAIFKSLVGYAIIASDFDGNVIAYNEGAHQIYSYTPEEIIGKKVIDIFFPKDFIKAGNLQKCIAELVEKGRLSYEGEMIKKNGKRFPAQILFTLTKNKNDKVVGFVIIVEDLTVRKRAEEETQRYANKLEQSNAELASNRAFLAAILDSTIDAILTVDEHGIIQSINKATIDLFGYKANELISKEIDILTSGDILIESLKSLSRKKFKGGGGRDALSD